ncbi:MAG: CAP domain-containing protein [Burkholderiaceae bacterium]
MLSKKVTFSQALLLSTAFLLAACGGSGSSTETTSTPAAETPSTGTPSAGTSATSTATPTPTPTPTPTAQTAPDCAFDNYQAGVVAAINSVRAAGAVCGGVAYPAVGALVWNGQLESAAAVHSTDMAVNNFFAHTSPTTGKSLRERLPEAGYRYSSAGENIAAGQTSASQVVADWVASPTHCANMMTPAFRDMGVSCKSNLTSTYQYYWTLEMGVR